MTDLRDQLDAFEAAARRLLDRPLRRRLVLVNARPATCHPGRAILARGLCKPCYEIAWHNGTLHQHPKQRDTSRVAKRREHFVADYELLRSEGYTRTHIAERLGMTYAALTQAYHRAVRAGALTPDRRTA